MQTSTPRKTGHVHLEGGEPVLAPSSSANKLAHSTAVHAGFMLKAVHDWLAADFERQEAGEVDDLPYLTRATEFLFSVIQYEQTFAEFCGKEKTMRSTILEGLESAIDILRGLSMDTRDMVDQIGLLKEHRAQLEATINAHNVIIEDLFGTLERIQVRVDALLAPVGQHHGVRRLN